MFEQTFKNIDDIFHKDAGCSSELDYTELDYTISPKGLFMFQYPVDDMNELAHRSADNGHLRFACFG